MNWLQVLTNPDDNSVSRLVQLESKPNLLGRRKQASEFWMLVCDSVIVVYDNGVGNEEIWICWWFYSIPAPDSSAPLHTAWKDCKTLVLSWLNYSVCPEVATSTIWIDTTVNCVLISTLWTWRFISYILFHKTQDFVRWVV